MILYRFSGIPYFIFVLSYPSILCGWPTSLHQRYYVSGQIPGRPDIGFFADVFEPFSTITSSLCTKVNRLGAVRQIRSGTRVQSKAVNFLTNDQSEAIKIGSDLYVYTVNGFTLQTISSTNNNIYSLLTFTVPTNFSGNTTNMCTPYNVTGPLKVISGGLTTQCGGRGTHHPPPPAHPTN